MTMTLVSTVTVGAGGAASIDFTSIPQTGTDLLIVFSTASAGSATGNTMQFNSDSGNNYSTRRLRGNGSTASSQTLSSVSAFTIASMPGTDSTPTSGLFNNGAVYIPNYAGSITKTISVDSVYEQNATAGDQYLIAGIWNNTNAITSIKLLAFFNFAQYSTASLYTITKGSGGATVS